MNSRYVITTLVYLSYPCVSTNFVFLLDIPLHFPYIQSNQNEFFIQLIEMAKSPLNLGRDSFCEVRGVRSQNVKTVKSNTRRGSLYQRGKDEM